jgi:hypothetical protein
MGNNPPCASKIEINRYERNNFKHSNSLVVIKDKLGAKHTSAAVPAGLLLSESLILLTLSKNLEHQ